MPSTLIPCMRYRHALAAIDWLCRAFGLVRHAVHADGDVVMHAQLVYEGGMIMVGSAERGGDRPYDRLMRLPDETGGSTMSVYLVVPDADVVYAAAKAAGARIVMDLVDQDHGGRGFTCLDVEGHVWSVGTYDPWAESSGTSRPSD